LAEQAIEVGVVNRPLLFSFRSNPTEQFMVWVEPAKVLWMEELPVPFGGGGKDFHWGAEDFDSTRIWSPIRPQKMSPAVGGIAAHARRPRNTGAVRRV
jgi:hypothetical protein